MIGPRNRRRLLFEGAALGLTLGVAGWTILRRKARGAADGADNEPVAHAPFGPLVPPLPVPHYDVLGDDAKRIDLARHLTGAVTAVQLIFTRCSATCPIQGALFAAVARERRASGSKLLSLTIDPEHDDPPALRAWMARFGAHSDWRAAQPRPEDVQPLLSYLRGWGRDEERHNAQVFLFDEEGRLAFRTDDMPPVAAIVDLLSQIGGGA